MSAFDDECMRITQCMAVRMTEDQVRDMARQNLTRQENSELKARVAELEEPQVGWTECPHCNMEHDVQLSRGRTNDPNRADQGGEGDS